MSNRIPRDFINDLLARIDVVDLISTRITLKRSGNSHVGLCPFHDEKTPSFNVSQSKQLYHCFGCGASGNAISFLMDYDHLSFVESIEDLAALAGVSIPRESNPSSPNVGEDTHAIFDLQEKVAAFYAHQLHQDPDASRAKNYLAQRGINEEIAKCFQLGFAPPEWQFLNSRFDENLLLKAGLIVKNEQGRVYDRFRNRIIFPIRNRRGRVIGFGGRVLDDSTPKYLNSAESQVFQKHREVYGLYELQKSTTHIEKIIVVEGYMDVIALAQHGVTNAVATLGTATSKDHIDLLFRSAAELIFCFDGDAAGEKAAWRALENSLSSVRGTKKIRFLQVPAGEDPDTLVRHEGAQAFMDRANNAALFSEYFFKTLTATLDLGKIEDRSTLVSRARPLASKIHDDVLREMVETHLAKLAQIKPVKAKEPKEVGRRIIRSPTNERRKPSTMRTTIALLLQYPGLAKNVEDATEWTQVDSKGAELLRKILSIASNLPNITSGGLLEAFRGQPEEQIVRQLMNWNTLIPESGVETEFDDAIQRLNQQQKEERLTALLEKADFLTDEEKTEMQHLYISIK